MVVEWHPGFPRYQIQHTATLEEPWQNLGEPTTAPTGDARFFTVVGLHGVNIMPAGVSAAIKGCRIFSLSTR